MLISILLILLGIVILLFVNQLMIAWTTKRIHKQVDKDIQEYNYFSNLFRGNKK